MSEKSQLRSRLLAARASLSPAQLAHHADQLQHHLIDAPELAAPIKIAAYAPVGTEPGHSSMLDALRRDGHTVLLPVIAGPGRLDWAVYTGVLVPGRLGCRQPDGPTLGEDAIADCAVIVVPAVAVDLAGNRLGRGGGFYDRALARVAADQTVVALLHDGELLAEVPVESHDRAISGAITPSAGWCEATEVDARPSGGAL